MPNYCNARTWRGLQCSSQRSKDPTLCKQHQRSLEQKSELPYGLYTAPITENDPHARLHRAAVCDKTTTLRYYSRDRMWGEAKKFTHINAVEDLGEDEFWECLLYVNEYYSKNKTFRERWHRG